MRPQDSRRLHSAQYCKTSERRTRKTYLELPSTPKYYIVIQYTECTYRTSYLFNAQLYS